MKNHPILLLAMIASLCLFAVTLALCLVAFRPAAPDPTGPRFKAKPESANIGRIESPVDFRYTFVVRNDGDAPLTLTLGKGNCKCLQVDIPEKPIAPGCEVNLPVTPTDIKDEKEEQPARGLLSRTVYLHTNDPERPDVSLVLNANIAPRLAVAPSPVTLSLRAKDLATPNDASSARTAESFVFSQQWDHFQVSVSKTSRKDMACRFEPATEDVLKDLDAKSGYRLVVTMPQDMPDGRFADWVDLLGTPVNSGTSSDTCRLKIDGNVGGRVEFHGPKLVQGDTILLGTISQGERAHSQVLVKVNDAQRTMALQKIETSPPFLHVKFTPYRNDTKNIGLYRLDVTVPPDAPTCEYMDKHRGVVKLMTNHPRLPQIEIRVDFAVVAKRA